MPGKMIKRPSGSAGSKVVALRRGNLVKKLFPLSGAQALNRILELREPEKAVRSLAKTDFFWLVKKIGEEDAYPLMRMATVEQWQYVLDIELWQRDRLNLVQTSQWLKRLLQADPARLAKWLSKEGEYLSFFYFFKNLEVRVKTEEDDYDLPGDFITFDNTYFFKVKDKANEQMIINILQLLASEDYARFQSLLLNLAGVLPAELEEEMYRLRNVRLAEEGFLPYEEAISVYAYINPDSLIRPDKAGKVELPEPEDEMLPVPLSPLTCAAQDNFLAQCTAHIHDSMLVDRIRIEFAGLCNQILSADNVVVDSIDTLVKVFRKAAGYVDIGLEKLSGGNLRIAEEILRHNSVFSVFRAGFSLALELKWEAERWVKSAWFTRQGLGPDFWGDEWGGMLSGLLEKRPRIFKMADGEEGFRDFENISEINSCRQIIKRLAILDKLLASLASISPLEKEWAQEPVFTFGELVFTFWARARLGLEALFAPISLPELKGLFRQLRSGERKPPYQMGTYKSIFIKDMISRVSGLEPEAAQLLEETLALLWDKFVDEYAWVGTDDIDKRYVKFILVE